MADGHRPAPAQATPGRLRRRAARSLRLAGGDRRRGVREGRASFAAPRRARETAAWRRPSGHRRGPASPSKRRLPDYDEYEVRVYDAKRGRQLVAAIEIVSPANKDRPEHRNVFVAKCAALLQKGVAVSIVDLVTVRHFNLYAELLAFIGHADPTLGAEPPTSTPPRAAGSGRGSGRCWKRGRTSWPRAAAADAAAVVEPRTSPSRSTWSRATSRRAATCGSREAGRNRNMKSSVRTILATLSLAQPSRRGSPRRRLAAVAGPAARRRLARDGHPRQVPRRRAEGPVARAGRRRLRRPGGRRRPGLRHRLRRRRRQDAPTPASASELNGQGARPVPSTPPTASCSGSTSTTAPTRSPTPPARAARRPLHGGKVYTLGAEGDLLCLDAAKGKRPLVEGLQEGLQGAERRSGASAATRSWTARS